MNNRSMYIFIISVISMISEDTDRHVLEDLVYTKVSGSKYIQGKLYEFIENMDIDCTKNDNGIYVNVSVISEDTLRDVYQKILHIESTQETYVENKETLVIEQETPPELSVTYQPFKLTKFQQRLLNLI